MSEAAPLSPSTGCADVATPAGSPSPPPPSSRRLKARSDRSVPKRRSDSGSTSGATGTTSSPSVRRDGQAGSCGRFRGGRPAEPAPADWCYVHDFTTRDGRRRCACPRDAAGCCARPAGAGRRAEGGDPRRLRERGLPRAPQASRDALETRGRADLRGAPGAGAAARRRHPAHAGGRRLRPPARRAGDGPRRVPAATRRRAGSHPGGDGHAARRAAGCARRAASASATASGRRCARSTGSYGRRRDTSSTRCGRATPTCRRCSTTSPRSRRTWSRTSRTSCRQPTGRSPSLLAETRETVHRYGVNVIVDNAATKGAPIVYEDHPTHRTWWAAWSTWPNSASWSRTSRSCARARSTAPTAATSSSTPAGSSAAVRLGGPEAGPARPRDPNRAPGEAAGPLRPPRSSRSPSRST